MKKFFMFIFFIINSIGVFSYTYEDYDIFIKGKSAYEKKDYVTAQQNFETLMNSFSYSPILQNNYAYYFIGMTYYKMEEYEKAVYYLQKAVFSHKRSFFNRGSDVERNIYFAERDYSLGEALLKTGNKELGMIYLDRLDYDTFSPITSHFEEKALLLLQKTDPEFKKYYDLKFKYNLKAADGIPQDELIKTAHFFLSRKKYSEAEALYRKILKISDLTPQNREKALTDLFRTLLRAGKNREVIVAADEYGKNSKDDIFFYYKGLAYYRLKDFSRCLYALENVKGKKYSQQALFYMTGIYYSFGDYETTLETAMKIPRKNILVEIMMANSYMKLEKADKFKSMAENIIKKYPNSYEGMFFAFILNNETIDLSKHNTLFKTAMIIDNFLSASKDIDSDFVSSVDLLEMDKISVIAAMKDEELIKIEIENSSFINKKSVQNGYAITNILEKGEFYDLAFMNSSSYRRDFFQYKSLIRYNYPLYYRDIVESVSKKYDVPQELIYTTMLLSSRFNRRAISENSRIGLMSIPCEIPEKISELFNPEINIEAGTKTLKELLEKYEGNKIKALIHYNMGEEFVENIRFDYDGDINLDSIADPEGRYELQNMIITYTFYKKLYNF